MRRLVLASLLLPLFLAVACTNEPKDRVTVYAAASLTQALEEIAVLFREETGVRVANKFGSSGSLAKEVELGGPADLFVSAHVEWTDRLLDNGDLVADSPRVLAWNRLAVVVPLDAVTVPIDPAELVDTERLVIGDPEHVPAGNYARQALQQLGLWDRTPDRLVYASNARAVLALVERGEAEAGVVYASDAAHSDRVAVAFLLPERSHEPIVYVAGLVRDAPRKDEARRYLEFLSGPRGKDVFRRYGLGGT